MDAVLLERLQPRDQRLPARKVWIAFAVGSSGSLTVDDGARRALEERGGSLLAAGITDVEGGFDEGDAVEIRGLDGRPFAKGRVRYDAATLRSDRTGGVVIHRDDLVVLP